MDIIAQYTNSSYAQRQGRYLSVHTDSYTFVWLNLLRTSSLINVRRLVTYLPRTQHGSDTRTYDREGRFVPQEFENIFSMFDKDRKGGLTFWVSGVAAS